MSTFGITPFPITGTLGKASKMWVQEAPSGPKNGVKSVDATTGEVVISGNTAFTLTWMPSLSTLTGNRIVILSKNGAQLTPFVYDSEGYTVLGGDYEVLGKTLILAVAPLPEDYIVATYFPDYPAVGGEDPTDEWGTVTRTWVHIKGSYYQNPTASGPSGTANIKKLTYVPNVGTNPQTYTLTDSDITSTTPESHVIDLIGLEHAANTYGAMPITTFQGDDTFPPGTSQTFERFKLIDNSAPLGSTLSDDGETIAIDMLIGGSLFWINSTPQPDSKFMLWDIYIVQEYDTGIARAFYPQKADVIVEGNRDLASVGFGAGTITCHRTSGLSDPSVIRFSDFVAAGAGTPLFNVRVNCAGDYYTDSAAQLWLPESGAQNSTSHTNSTPVTGTSDPQVYSTYREATTIGGTTAPGMQYRVACSNGTYTMKFYFADPTMTTAGNRVFDIYANEVRIATNVDIALSAGGANKAYVLTVTGVTNSQGYFIIDFRSIVAHSIVCGIEVIKTA